MRRTALEWAIAQLTRLLRGNESAEKKYQRFFEDNPIVFEALGYATAYPRPRFSLSAGRFLEPDFLVQRTDGLFEIFELKTPQERLIVCKSHRDKLGEKVNEYISQVNVYSDYFDDTANRDRVKDEFGFDVQQRPDLSLVVGRDSGVDKKLLHLLVRRQTNALRIFTYDDLLSQLRFYHAALFGRAENLSGASWHAILTLHPVKVSRRQYIFDAGDSLTRNRWSVYVDEQGQLAFEILDQEGRNHLVAVAPGTRDLAFGFRHYICCEFGSTDGFSIMQMLVDNRLAAIQESTSPIHLSSALDFSRKTIAADLEGKNHGTFDMAGLAIYKNTLTFDQKLALAEAIFDEFFSPPDLEQLALARGTRRVVLPNTSAYLVIGEQGKLK